MTATMTTTASPASKALPTHELFDVQEREGQRAFWNKVGAAFVNKDGSHSVLIYQPGLPSPKRLQLRPIDRQRRPLAEGADPKRAPSHELFFVADLEGEPKEWRRVGVGFTNKDGSLSLIVDDGLREGPKARFQMRPRRDVPAAEPPTAEPPTSPKPATSRSIVRRKPAA